LRAAAFWLLLLAVLALPLTAAAQDAPPENFPPEEFIPDDVPPVDEGDVGPPAWADSTDMQVRFPVQGDCSSFSPPNNVDYAKGTYSCPGVGYTPLMINFPGFAECVYVQNNTAEIFFIPSGTQEEWMAFRNNPPAGVTLITCPN